MKKWLAYIFLVIFSFQVIPVKELGKLLFKGQVTEEEVIGFESTTDESPNLKLKKETDPFHPNTITQDHARIEFLTHQLITAIHIAERLPNNFVPEIFTPPPNC